MRKLMHFQSNHWFFPVSTVILLLTMMALACNLTSQDAEPTQVGPARAIQTTIVSPAANSAFKVREPIIVQATIRDPDGTGVTRVELLANNIVVDQKPSLSPSGDKELTVNLTWNAPQTPGNVVLIVRPFRGTIQGTVATLPITITDSNIVASATGNATTSSGGTSPTRVFPTATYNPICRARIDVNRLNFRNVPNSDSDDSIIGYYLIGDEAVVLGRLFDNSWFRVRAIVSSAEGWVYGPYTTLLGNCTTVPVLNAPATPTPTRTPTLQPSEQPKADIVALSPSGLTTLQADAEGKATANYTFTVQNVGSSNTGNFRVRISLSDGSQFDQDIPSLTPGQVYSFPAGGLPIQFNSPGSHRIFYEADVNNQVNESNEGNNMAFLDVSVVAP